MPDDLLDSEVTITRKRDRADSRRWVYTADVVGRVTGVAVTFKIAASGTGDRPRVAVDAALAEVAHISRNIDEDYNEETTP